MCDIDDLEMAAILFFSSFLDVKTLKKYNF